MNCECFNCTMVKKIKISHRNSKIIPLTAGNSKIIPMTVEGIEIEDDANVTDGETQGGKKSGN